MMRKNTLPIFLVILLICPAFLPLWTAGGVGTVHNIDTGEDFSTIQAAIDDPDGESGEGSGFPATPNISSLDWMIRATVSTAKSGTTVFVFPATKTVDVGETFSIDIKIADVTDLTCWEFKLYFSNAVLECTVAVEGPFLRSGGSTFLARDIDNANGKVHLACALLGLDVQVSGSGVLASITFDAVASGESTLHLDDTKLGDEHLPPLPIPHTTVDGTVNANFYGTDNLAIVDAEPVQVVYGASALVADKPTLVKVDILNTFSESKRTTLTLVFDGQQYSTDVKLLANQVTTFYMPADDYILPSLGTSIYSASVDAIPGEQDTTNNEKTGSITVEEANELKILYVPVCFFGETPVSYEDASKLAADSNKFIKGTYPVSPASFDYYVSSIPIYFSPMPSLINLHLSTFEMCTTLHLTAILTGHSRAVGVLPNDWFSDKGDNTLGLAYSEIGLKGVLVENHDKNPWATTAHEIGHTYGLWAGPGPEEYDVYDPPDYLGRRDASGVWVTKRQSGGALMGDYYLREEKYCFMGKYVYPTYGAHWIDYDCYENLLSVFTGPSVDPEVLFLSGLIYENDTVETDCWYRIENGTASLDFESTGDYSVVYVDDLEEEIGTVGFDPIFICTENATGQNVTGFAFTIPYLQNASKIQIRHNNVSIYEKVVSANGPFVNVLSPNGGETVSSGDNCTVSWESTDLDGDPLLHEVFYSIDNGSSWIPLAVNVTSNSIVWNTSCLQSSNSYLVKVLASDGIHTCIDVSNSTFTVVAHDVAINELEIPTNEIIVGQVANISIAVANEGDFNETFSVTAYADNNLTIVGDEILIETQNVTGLDASEMTTLTFSWNTTSAALGEYVISAQTTVVPGETDTADNSYIGGTVQIKLPPNLVVTKVLVNNQNCTVYANDTYINGTSYYVLVEVTFENAGNASTAVSGSFNASLTVYWVNGSLQEDYVEWRVPSLDVHENITLTFSWRPTHRGYYNLTAVADSASEVYETYEGDDVLCESGFPVALQGDVNGDGLVDIMDAVVVCLAWGATPADPQWNICADLNHDNQINIMDAVRVCLHWGQTW